LFSQRALNEISEKDEVMTVLSPVQVLERRRQVLAAQDIDAFIELFADDAVMELPFAGPGMPARLEGQAAIREFSKRSEDMPLRVDDVVTTSLYETSDPELVVIEIVTKGTLTTTGQTFEAPCIQVFRIRDGQIHLMRDYFNPVGLTDLLAD
jgi:ketosteroid isomerase-like protein